MGNNKPLDPTLLKSISFNDYTKRYQQPGVKIEDTDGDGKVTHRDTIRTTATGNKLEGSEKVEVLTKICGEMAPRDTYITGSKAGLDALKRNGATIVKGQPTKDGRKYDELMIGSSFIPSYGGYAASLLACNYNRTGFHIDTGQNKNEVTATYEDATGPQTETIPLRADITPKPLPPPPGYKGME